MRVRSTEPARRATASIVVLFNPDRRRPHDRQDGTQPLPPLKRAHRDLLLNWFRAKGAISAAIVEGLNANAKLAVRRAHGFRTYEATKTALYHVLGALLEPECAHTFC